MKLRKAKLPATRPEARRAPRARAPDRSALPAPGPARPPATIADYDQPKPPILARTTLYAVVAAIAASVYWAATARIDEIVVAQGKLVTTTPTLVVQPLETSIIRSITVRAGDIVHKGQVLATLDPTFSAADAGEAQNRLEGYEAQIARLTAEIGGRTYTLPARPSPEQQMQWEIATQRSAAYASRLADFAAQIANAQATLVSARNEEAVLAKKLSGLQEIGNMRSSLFRSGSGSRLDLLQGRDVAFDTELDLTRTKGQIAATEQLLAKTRAEQQNYMDDYRRATLEQLVDVEEKRSAAAEDLKKANLRATLSQLVAPADAAVLEVAQRSIASVVQPAEPLITLVPLNVPLEAEVSVAASDIGRLTTGDSARIKLDAFPFQEHGTISGTVSAISEDSFTSEPGTAGSRVPFYRLRLALGPQTLKGTPEGFRLLPGMTVSAEVEAGERTVISYFLYPLIRGLDESLHEP